MSIENSIIGDPSTSIVGSVVVDVLVLDGVVVVVDVVVVDVVVVDVVVVDVVVVDVLTETAVVTAGAPRLSAPPQALRRSAAAVRAAAGIPRIAWPRSTVHLDDERVALPTTPAERSDADTAAPALEFVGEVDGDSSARHADRVPECDGTAVDVDDVGGDTQVSHRCNGDGGERLVELEKVDIVEGESRPFECDHRRSARLGEE